LLIVVFKGCCVEILKIDILSNNFYKGRIPLDFMTIKSEYYKRTDVIGKAINAGLILAGVGTIIYYLLSIPSASGAEIGARKDSKNISNFCQEPLRHKENKKNTLKDYAQAILPVRDELDYSIWNNLNRKY
jgi:hypothetical protein